jgi:hypothetical protein
MSKSIFSLFCCVLFLSCAKPTDPESLAPSSGGYSVVGRLQLPGYAEDIEVKDTLAYVAQGEGGLAILSIANRSKPELLSMCQEGVRGTSHKLALNGSTVYVAANLFGVSVVDVSNPLVPVATASNLNIKPAQSLHVFGDWLLSAIGETGVKVGEISFPVPDIRGGLQNPGYALGLATTADSSLVVACGEMGITIYDIRDISWYGGPGGGWYDFQKRYAGWVDLPGYAVSVTTMGSQRIAFVACGTAGIHIVDFSDTTSADSIKARVVGSYATGGYAKEVAYSNGRLYVATELRGLQVLSVVNPAAPQLVGVVETEFALGVAVDEHYVYVADEDQGLIIISIPPY